MPLGSVQMVSSARQAPTCPGFERVREGDLSIASSTCCDCDTNHSGSRPVPEERTDHRDTNAGCRLPIRLPIRRNKCVATNVGTWVGRLQVGEVEV